MDQQPPAAAYGPSPQAREVVIRHPAYRDPATRLLVLSVPAGSLGTSFDLAMDACCIITGCSRSNGHFIFVGDDGERKGVWRPRDGLLRPGPDYMFVINGFDWEWDYSIIPSFQHWRFPHDQLPPHWDELRIPDGGGGGGGGGMDGSAAAAAVVRARDETCRITGDAADAEETAYIVPASERDWFMLNDMLRYCRNGAAPSPIDDDRNRMLLRRDIRLLFDGQGWALVPKMLHGPSPAFGRIQQEEGASSGGGSGGRKPSLVSHLLQCSAEKVRPYHGQDLQGIQGLSVEFLYARFAWCVFQTYVEQFYQPYNPQMTYHLRVWKGHINPVNPWDIRPSYRHSVFIVGRLFGPAEGDVVDGGCNGGAKWIEFMDSEDEDDYDSDEVADDEFSLLPLDGGCKCYDDDDDDDDDASRESSPGSVSTAPTSVTTTAGDSAGD